jgi:hypothetical protein
MVPRVGLPPEVLFTDQVTVVLVEPVTVAEKVRWAESRILAVDGETEMETEAGGGVTGLGFVEDEQEASTKSESRRQKMENRVGTMRPGWGQRGEDIAEIV